MSISRTACGYPIAIGYEPEKLHRVGPQGPTFSGQSLVSILYQGIVTQSRNDYTFSDSVVNNKRSS